MASIRSFIRDVLVLGKARISAMAMFTGYAAIVIEGSEVCHAGFIAWCLTALFLVGTGANTINQIIERKKDATMNRTKAKRPLPSGRISVPMAWFLAWSQIGASIAILGLVLDSWPAAGWAAFTVVYYSFFYTMYLKPRHYLNIVVGGVPGAMGPVIAWAAATGEVAATAWILFAIIFLWTPPHVWALAIKLKEDYARAGIPMLPVVKGVDETSRQIFIYTVIMVLGSVMLPLLAWHHFRGPVYWLMAIVLGIGFLRWSWRVWKTRPMPPTMPLFRYSLVYIGLLFLGLVIDHLVILERGLP